VLTSIAGFTALNASGISGDSVLNGNTALNCTNPTPNFVPVTESLANQVNCAVTP